MNKNKFLASALTASLVAGVVVPVAGVEASESFVFTDVGESNTHYDSIEYAYTNGFISGYPDGSFRPGDPIMRKHVALIMARALGGSPDVEYKDSGFTDVPDVYKWAVDFLVEEEILYGKSADYFGSDDYTTRGQMAKILSNSYDYGVDDDSEFVFTDVPKVYEDYVKSLVDNGITVGIGDNKYGTSDYVTRGQFASFIHRSEIFKETNDVLDIEFFEILNSKEFSLEFTKDMDINSLISKSNYLIKLGKDKVDLNSFDIEVVNDKKIIFILKEDLKISNGSYLDLEIVGEVYAKNLEEYVDFYGDKIFYDDKEAPEFLNVSKDGNDIILNFNEYITDVDIVKINGKEFSDISIEDNSKEIKLKNVNSILNDGINELMVSGVKDLSDNKSGVIILDLPKNTDSIIPTVENIEQKDNYSFEVQFSNDVEFVGDGGINLFQNGVKLQLKTTEIDKRTYLVDITENNSFDIYENKDSVKLNLVIDGYRINENGIMGETHDTLINFSKDKTAPSIVEDGLKVVDIGVDGKTDEVIQIHYDEEITIHGDKSDIFFTSKGIRQDVSDVKVVKDKDGVDSILEISLDSLQNEDGEFLEGDYIFTLSYKFLSDKYLNYNFNEPLFLEVGDKDSEVKVTVEASNNVISVKFTNEMSDDVLEFGNYSIDGKELSKDTKIYFKDKDREVVIIELEDESINEDGGAVLSIGDVKDKDGKELSKDSKTLFIETGFVDNTSPILLSGDLISLNEIELTFSEVIDDSTLLDGKADEDFIINISGIDYGYSVSTGISDDNKIIIKTDDNFSLKDTIIVEVNDSNDDLSITDKSGNIIAGNIQLKIN